MPWDPRGMRIMIYLTCGILRIISAQLFKAGIARQSCPARSSFQAFVGQPPGISCGRGLSVQPVTPTRLALRRGGADLAIAQDQDREALRFARGDV